MLTIFSKLWAKIWQPLYQEKLVLKVWFSHLREKEEQEDFRLEVIASQRVLRRLSQIIENKQDSSVRGMKSKTNFKDPNWTHNVADSLGYQRALDEVKELLEVTK